MTDSTCFKSFSIYRVGSKIGTCWHLQRDGGRECQFTCDRWRISVRRKDREKEDALELMCNITREKS
ncbi:hypothetical protein Gorai_017791 [Gossypium raimondii]|uniref:Uncharacterized protein n=1 Tax=Gossypium raimondii TaxID=29730 RepID=A0A7J8PIB4_GOSRA|nr:hypothetical protein [Gossypium raimondii]